MSLNSKISNHFNSYYKFIQDYILIFDSELEVVYFNTTFKNGFDIDFNNKYQLSDFFEDSQINKLLKKNNNFFDLKIKNYNLLFKGFISEIFYENNSYILVSFNEVLSNNTNLNDNLVMNIIDNIPEPASVHYDKKVVYHNDKLLEVLEVSKEQLSQMTTLDFIHPDFLETAKERIKNISLKGEMYKPFEYKFITAKGKTKFIEVYGIPVKFQGKSSAISIFKDVTKSKEIEIKSSEKDLLFNTIMDLNTAAIFVHNFNKILIFNKALEKLLGFTSEEIKNLNFWELINPKDRKKLKKNAKSRLQGLTQTGNYEIEILKKSGEKFWVNILAKKIIWNNEDAILVVAFDITDKKKKESTLIESEKRLREILDAIPEAIIIHENNQYLYLNKSAYKMFKAKPEDALEFKPSDYVLPEYKEQMFNNIKKLTSGEIKNTLSTYKIYDLEKNILDIEISGLLFEFQGKQAIMSVMRNVTDRKQIEKQLQEKNLIFETIFNLTNTGFLIHQNNKFVMVNKATTDISGYTEKELLGKKFWELVHPDMQEQVKKIGIKRIAKENVPDRYEMKVLRKDGSIAWIDFSANKIIWKGQPATLGTAYDITEKKKAAEENKILLLAIEQSPVTVVITDASGHIIYVNKMFEKVTGYTKEEVVGQNPRFLKSDKQTKEFYRDLWDRISSGGSWQGTFVNKAKNGRYFTEEANIVPIFNEQKEITNYIAIKLDITKRLELETQYLQSQKMESVGRLAGGVAHDFNNMLNVILNYATLLMKSIDKSSKPYNYVNQIYTAAERSANLTSQLLTYARKQTITPKVIDLNILVTDLFEMLKRLIRSEINIELKTYNDILPVKIDSTQFHQLLINLCVNAADAIKGKGNINIILDRQLIENDNLKFNFPYKDYALIRVQDNGKGMDDETLLHIFEPFYTTKNVGEGTGLGLSTVYGIVKQNAGYIDVKSKLGAGTEFIVYLPISKENIDDIIENETKITEHIDSKILIIEDETSLLDVTKMILEDAGYSVLDANNAEAALGLIKEHKDDIKLVLSDVIMPDINGIELAKKIKEIVDVKFIFMSGYSEDVISDDNILSDEINFIQKPYTVGKLLELITEVLKK